MPFHVGTNINFDLSGLLKNKKIVIDTATIILVLIISGNIYSRLNRTNLKLKEELALEKKKNELLNQLSESEEKMSRYKESLNRKDITSIINAINTFAQESGLKIISVRPEPGQDFPTYTKLTTKLSILSNGFHKIGYFISKLESAPDLYKIDLLSIKRKKKLGTESDSLATLDKELTIEVEIVISRFTFKG